MLHGAGCRASLITEMEGPESSRAAVRLQIAPMEVGRINIQYRRTECTPPEPLNVDINHNFGPGAWLRIVVSVRLPALAAMPLHTPCSCAWG